MSTKSAKKLTKDETAAIQKVISANLRSWRHLGREECEDMASMAWVTFLERLPRYDPSRAKLTTFADHAVKSALLDWYRKYFAPRGSDRSELVATYNNHVDGLFGPTGSANGADSISAESRMDLYDALDTLKGREREMAQLYLTGMTQAEISRFYGLTEGRIAQCMKAITVKLRTPNADIAQAQDCQG